MGMGAHSSVVRARLISPLAIVGVALFSSLFVVAAPSDAAAQQRINGPECREAYRKYQAAPLIKAFSLSRDGLACGTATGYETVAEAERGASQACAKHKRDCRIIASSGPAATPQSAGCRDALAKWRDGGETFRAFALSGNGHGCAWNLNAASKQDGESGALAECSKKNKGCHIVASHEPVEILKERQRQLQALGYYKGEIDGKWGSGSRAALEAFRLAENADGVGEREIFTQLTKKTGPTPVVTTGRPEPDLSLLSEARVLEKEAIRLYWQGSYSEAEALHLRALAVREQRLGGEHHDTLASVTELANVYWAQGRLVEAEKFHSRARVARARLLGDDHADTLYSSQGLAFVYLSQGRYAESATLFAQVLSSRERALGEDHLDTLKAASGLGLAYDKSGRLAEAERLHTRVLAGRERMLGANHQETIWSLINLAIVYWKQNRLQDASRLYYIALSKQEHSLGMEHLDTLQTLNNLAIVLEGLGILDEAESAASRALVGREKLLGKDHPDTLNSANNLAMIYDAQGRHSDSETINIRILEVRKRVFGESHPDTLTVSHNLAENYADQGRAEEAEKIYRNVLTARESILGKHHPYTLLTANRLALLYQRHGRNTDAANIWQQAFAALPLHFASGSARPGSSGDAELPIGLPQYFASISKSDVPVAQQNRMSFEGQGWWKFGRLDVALADLGARMAIGGNTAAVLRDFQDARERLAGLRSAFTKTFEDVQRGEAMRRKVSDELNSAEQKFEELRARIKRQFPALADLTLPRALKADEAQALLAPGEALIAYAATKEALYAWLVTGDRVEWRQIPMRLERLRSLVSDLSASVDLTRPALNRSEQARCAVTGNVPALADRPFDACRAKELYDFVLGGFDLSGIDHLIVVPDGPLETIPFSTLVTGFREDGRPRWLIEDRAVSMLPTTSSLRALRQSGAEPATQADGQKPYLGIAPGTFGTRGPASPLRAALGDLPSTAQEVRFLSGMLGAGDEGAVTGPAASEAFAKKASLIDYRVLSFATHALLSNEAKEATAGTITEPALVLGAGNGEDGLLTAGEVAALRLNADWVLLSACNTAGGDADGLSGLARAFFFAGARSLLVSHWSIDDEAAMELMVETIRRNERDSRLGKAQALRQAMLTVMNRKPEWAHPFFWAPFSLVGVDAVEGIGGRLTAEQSRAGQDELLAPMVPAQPAPRQGFFARLFGDKSDDGSVLRPVQGDGPSEQITPDRLPLEPTPEQVIAALPERAVPVPSTRPESRSDTDGTASALVPPRIVRTQRISGSGAVEPNPPPLVEDSYGWSVQIASASSEEEARRQLAEAVRLRHNVVSGLNAVILRSKVRGGDELFQVRIPTSGSSAAAQLCRKYRAAGGECFEISSSPPAAAVTASASQRATGLQAGPSTPPPAQLASSNQRAIFYQERTALADGTAHEGNVVWSLMQESPGGDQRPEPAIVGEVNIPQLGMNLRMTIRRNHDPSLEASHIIEMIFTDTGTFEGGGLKQVLRIAFKPSEADAGKPLTGLPTRVANGYFLFALSNDQAERAKNVQLMLSESWIDIPIVYGSGRRALVTIEKGASGNKVFEAALDHWTNGAPKPASDAVAAKGPTPQPPSDDLSAAYLGGSVSPGRYTSASVPDGGWSMQIASQPTAEGAIRVYQDLVRRYDAVIGESGFEVVRADVPGKGTYYRVRIPAGNRADAIALCGRYKTAGGSCFVSR